MKNQLVVGNWKATKTIKETIEWVNLVKNGFDKNKSIQIVICPPFTSLHTLKSLSLETPYLKVGAQDVSKFKKGAYTGEVTVEMLEGLVDYCIVNQPFEHCCSHLSSVGSFFKLGNVLGTDFEVRYIKDQRFKSVK